MLGSCGRGSIRSHRGAPAPCARRGRANGRQRRPQRLAVVVVVFVVVAERAAAAHRRGRRGRLPRGVLHVHEVRRGVLVERPRRPRRDGVRGKPRLPPGGALAARGRARGAVALLRGPGVRAGAVDLGRADRRGGAADTGAARRLPPADLRDVAPGSRSYLRRSVWNVGILHFERTRRADPRLGPEAGPGRHQQPRHQVELPPRRAREHRRRGL
mmetsp:Transcript_48128/g.154138  ORF Transcript_48128/g.154138 Transcript_48128/m.154138 type:complete len:214 (+) Transcript_48128:308-949(+)